jgi:hypothetical protein
MKKIYIPLFVSAALVIVTGIAFAINPIKVFVDDKEVKNDGNYIINNGKVFVSGDALDDQFGFSTFYDKKDNKIRIYDNTKTQLEARSNMFEEFVKSYDPKNPDEVVDRWAKGVKDRNGVEQFVTLSEPLKKEFKKTYADRPSWVTGVSSPWVESYKITKKKVNDSEWNYTVIFTTKTSAPGDYYYTSQMTVGKENDKWRITKLKNEYT